MCDEIERCGRFVLCAKCNTYMMYMKVESLNLYLYLY